MLCERQVGTVAEGLGTREHHREIETEGGGVD